MPTNMDSRKLSLMHRYLMDRYYGGGADEPIEIPQQYASEAEAAIASVPGAAPGLTAEPYANETARSWANKGYDRGQPYGFDFSGDHNLRDPGGRYSIVHPDGYVERSYNQEGDLAGMAMRGEGPQLPAPVPDDPGTAEQLMALLPLAVQMGGGAMGHPIAGMAGATALRALMSKMGG